MSYVYQSFSSECLCTCGANELQFEGYEDEFFVRQNESGH
jgi:hypothetical protein